MYPGPIPSFWLLFTLPEEVYRNLHGYEARSEYTIIEGLRTRVVQPMKTYVPIWEYLCFRNC